ncbi:MAG: DNA mismatch repair endonuclease MutL [Deltaproteobacteria bacterium]|nr:DNA mismatch repair endonuclease MutL [Deltaproteobacteria bacterium]
MGRIALLPSDVANQIAAGEVVERPASVVKELVENSLDAGAEVVTVAVDGGGLGRLAITDDGAGMLPEDLRLAVVRHATSKIRSVDDLVGVSTFGFRGEALPSIASVSRMRIVTRPRGADEGTEAVIEGGAEAVLRPAGCAVGTTITVEDLFYNTPARRKFMRTPQTEGAACVEALVRLAIPRPGVRFVVRRDGRVARELLRHKDVASRVKELWPEEQLAELRGARGAVQVTALLGPPERARTGATQLALYVNGRHVRDRMLLKAVQSAYGSTLDGGRYPVGALLLELPAQDVDVNVHPQKTEVRFSAQGSVFEAVASVLRDAAAGAPWAQAMARPRDFWSSHLAPGPSLDTPATTPHVPPPPPTAPHSEPPVALPATASVGASPAAAVPRAPGREGGSPNEYLPQVLNAWVDPAGEGADPWSRLVKPPYPPSGYGPAEAAPATPAGTFGGLRYVAQLRRMYLLCEGEQGMVLLDQHAAAERVTFERLRKAYAARKVPMQPMLVPERVELSPEDVARVEEHQAELLTLGLELSALGPTSVAVRAVPALLLRADPRRLTRDLVAELGRQGQDFSRAVDLVLATMACHGSVRGGDVLADDEARGLLAALDAVDFAGHCPHGRPVLWSMKWSELDRKVGRV